MTYSTYHTAVANIVMVPMLNEGLNPAEYDMQSVIAQSVQGDIDEVYSAKVTPAQLFQIIDSARI